jgi:hypothetical protein
MVSVERYKVPDIPALYLYYILILSSYVKLTYILHMLCRHRFHISLLLRRRGNRRKNAPTGLIFAIAERDAQFRAFFLFILGVIIKKNVMRL